jgi:hypothetical protein
MDDFEIVQRHLPAIEPAFSWHNPTPNLLRRSAALVVKGLMNVYGDSFVKQMSYYSDSNMRYSVANFEQIIREQHQPLHLLFHPINWIIGGDDMADVLARAWQYIIREREQEIVLNRTYERLFPQGMPSGILENLSDNWLEAAGKKRAH